jgi:prepilin-type processing-associated H-X9-DG protein
MEGRTLRVRRSTPSFTLIELLVVVAIVLLLAALLMPALKSAREKAKQIACVSTLKQLHILFTLYTDTYDGYVLPTRIYAPNSGPVSNWDQILKVARLLKYNVYEDWRFGPLLGAPAQPPNEPVQCPVWARQVYAKTVPEYTYAVNIMQTWRPGISAWWGVTGLHMDAWRKFTDIDQPADRFWVCDGPTMYPGIAYGCAYRYNDPNPLYPWVDINGITGEYSTRHGAGINLLYFDGHVGFWKGPLPGQPIGNWGAAIQPPW